ncbi:MAG: hypothetical protein ACI4Q3_02190 [Kiritimatiellia bacterium]
MANRILPQGTLLISALALGVPLFASADYITLTAFDTVGQTSFTEGTRWSDGQVPSADKDYLVAIPGREDAQIRTPDTGDASKAYTFAGRSLTIGTRVGIVGDADVAGYYLSKTVNGKITTPDLRLVNGVYWLGTDGNHYHNGTITVLSPEENPFLLQPRPSGTRNIHFGASFKGAAGTGLKISEGRCYLNGQSPEFLGRLRVDTGATVTFNNADALGGVRPDYDPDALLLDRGRIVYNGSDNAELGASRNVGVTVTANGGEIGVNQTLKFTATVTGAGVLARRDTAPCTFDCWGTLSNAGGFVHDSPGYFKANTTASFAPDCALVMSNGFVTAGATGAYTFTNRVVFAGGGISGGGSVGTDGTVSPHSIIRFDGPLEILKPIRLALRDFPSGAYTHDTLFPLAEIPSSVRVVTAADFELAFSRGAVNWCGLPRNSEVVVTTAADGLQTVCVRFDPIVYNSTTANPSYFTSAGHWSDGQAAHAGADYVVRNYDVRQCDNSAVTATYTFPGESLSLLGDNGTAHGYVIKQRTVTFSELRVYDYSYISIGGHDGSQGETQTLKADRIVVSTSQRGNSGFSFLGSQNRLAIIAAPFTGTCCIRYSGCRFRPLQDNSGFTGAVQLAGEATLEFSDETNLGGNPPAFDATAVEMTAGSVLCPLASCTLDDSNRGLTSSDSVIEVNEGLELTTQLKISLLASSSIKKRGAGTWALGGSVTSSGTVSIEAGTLKAIASNAVQNANLAFADGAKFAIGPEVGALGLVAVKTFTVAGATLPVTVTPPAGEPAVYEQPLFTVAAENADALAGKLAVAKPKGYRVEILKTATTVGSTAAVTLTAKFAQDGFTILLR